MIASTKEGIATRLSEARERTLLLLEPLDDGQLNRVYSEILSPLAWDLGHIANFEELWLVQTIGGREPMHGELGRFYDAIENPRKTRGQLPILRAHYASKRDSTVLSFNVLVGSHKTKLGIDSDIQGDGATVKLYGLVAAGAPVKVMRSTLGSVTSISPAIGDIRCPGRGGGPNRAPPLTGLTYFQTISFSGVTSKMVPLAPEQMNVFPLGSRWAPEMNEEKKSSFFGAV